MRHSGADAYGGAAKSGRDRVRAGAGRADPGRERDTAAADAASGSERRAAGLRRPMGSAEWAAGRVREHELFRGMMGEGAHLTPSPRRGEGWGEGARPLRAFSKG